MTVMPGRQATRTGRPANATPSATGSAEGTKLIRGRSRSQLFAAAAIAALLMPAAAFGQDAVKEPECEHAISLIGAPKMPAGFEHFDWVNPDAPKGGTIRQYADGGFDTLNPFSDKGVKAAGLGLTFDSLMASSPDEPSTGYGLIAECVMHPEDYSSATFRLRPEARFHDGKPITPEDVVFSFEKLKTANPFFGYYYKNVTKAEKTGDNEVTFTFDVKGNRELPMIMGELSILPKHHFDGKTAGGEPRDVAKSTMEPILGSGAYKIKSFEASRRIVLERVKDYWAKDLPVMRGQFNFDAIEYIYYRDRTPAFEDFKTGKIDLWVENQAGAWATQYGFDALKRGGVIKKAFPVERVSGMQAFVFNLRRKQFQDARVRRAFNLLFNYEEVNKKLFYGLYVRSDSYFDNSELESKGLPQGKELEILETVRDLIPSDVFTAEWSNPVNTEQGDFRTHQRAAMKLFNDAGWKLGKDRVMRNDAGEPFVVEFLIDGDTFQRIILPYVESLKTFGIQASIRVVDSAQYKQREDNRDFDMIVDSFGQSLSPGNEQRQFWGSDAAGKNASRNTAGIANPAIDKLIDAIVFAKDRAELVAATKALDRVLKWNHYVVPHWFYPFERLAYWNLFGLPDKLPSQTSAPLQVWWYDSSKSEEAKALGWKS